MECVRELVSAHFFLSLILSLQELGALLALDFVEEERHQGFRQSKEDVASKSHLVLQFLLMLVCDRHFDGLVSVERCVPYLHRVTVLTLQ